MMECNGISWELIAISIHMLGYISNKIFPDGRRLDVSLGNVHQPKLGMVNTANTSHDEMGK